MLERFTKRARDVVVRAQVEARAVASPRIGPEHLFGALLADPQCLAVRILDGLGVPAQRARAVLAEQLPRPDTAGLDHSEVQALKDIGIDVVEVLRRLEAGPGGPPDTAPPKGRRHIPFTPAAKKVLELALREAIALRHNYIGTEHLLLALTRQSSGPVAATLADLTITRAGVHSAVLEALRDAG